MKKIFILIFNVFFSISLFSQTKTEVYFGVSGRKDGCSDIIELYDKGYYLTGGFEGSTYDFGWNIKTDINLEMIYDKVLENSLSTIAPFSSVSDKNGNIYITGFMNYPVQWPFVIKIDSCGNKVWCKVLDYSAEGFDFGAGKDVILTKDNEVILLTGFESESQMEKVHLICLGTDGEVLWKKPYASQYQHPWIRNPSGYHITEINNDYYISGYCYWPYPDDTTHFFLRPLFIGVDSLFKEKWILPFAPLDSVYGDAYNSIALNDSVFMGVGISRLSNSVDFGLLMFYNKDGEELGYSEITNEQIGPDINSNEIRDIQKINDSLFIAAVFFGSDFSENPVGEFILDTAANLYNFESRPSTITSPSLIKTYDENYVISTSIKENKSDWDIYVYKIDENLNDVPFDPTPHTYDSLCPGGIQSGTIDLSDCFVWTNVGDAPTPEEYFASLKIIPVKAYPNPVTCNKITFEYENTEYHQNMELRCFNIYGKEIHKEKIYRYQGKSVVNVSNWQKGMYFAVVYSAGKAVGRCKFVVR